MFVLVPPDMDAPAGMQTLYADKSEAYRVEYANDEVYAVRDGIPLHLQMLYPGNVPVKLMEARMPENASSLGAAFAKVKPAERFPLIVYVEGSAWMKQDCYRSLPMFVDFARRGYAVAFVEYRPSDVAPWPAFLLDVKAAIRYLKANADLYSIDKERIAIWGSSSGGNASLLTGVTGWMRDFDDELCGEETSAVKAVVDFYGVTDIPKMFERPRDEVSSGILPSPEDILFRSSVVEHPEVTAPGNPINYIFPDKPCPPVLIVHGDQDGTVPFNQSVLLYNKLVECGKQVDFYKVKGAGHGMYFWTKEVLDTTISFLDAYLK